MVGAMNIVIAAPVKDPINEYNCRGSLAACIRLANGLAERGHDIALVGRFGFGSESVLSKKIKMINVSAGKKRIKYSDVFDMLKACSINADIINTHYDTYGIMKYLHEITHKPVVHVLHSWVQSTDVSYYSKDFIIKTIENPNIYMVCVNDSQYDILFKELKVPKKTDNFVKITHGISNLDHITFDKSLVPPGCEIPYFLTIGRIRKSKRIDVIIEAAIEANISLIVLGKTDSTYKKSDSYVENIEKLVASNKNIHWINQLSHENTLQLIKGAKVLILNSTFDTFSLVTLEAAMLGVPTIINRHGGTQEIRTQLSGRGLVEYDGSKKELSAILKAFNGSFNTDDFPEELKWEYMLDKYERLFTSIVKGGSVDYYQFV